MLIYSSSVGEPLARALSEQGLPAQFVKSSDFDLEAPFLKVTTLHAAKGLEFPIVAIAHVEAGRLPRETAASEYKHGRKRTRTGKRVKGIGFISEEICNIEDSAMPG